MKGILYMKILSNVMYVNITFENDCKIAIKLNIIH